MSATQAWVNERLVPFESSLQNVREGMEQMTTKIETRDADWAVLEKRVEEVAQMVKEMEIQIKKIADGTT